MSKLREYFQFHPPMIVAISFMVLIFIGSFFLFLPISQVNNDIGYLDCLFTATSSVCVTGLTTVPTYSSWTVFGKTVIIILIQVGGLGVMTFATFTAMLLGRKITLSERKLIKEQTNSIGLEGMVRLIKYILISTFVIETCGALLLMVRFIPKFGMKGIPISFFHSISAFCNAGFDILGENSLISYNNDPYLLTIIGILIFLGGLGFIVYSDLFSHKFDMKRVNLHTKIVLLTTFVLLFVSTIFFLYLEGRNPNTLLNRSVSDKIFNSLFQAITLRTCGFAAIDQTKMTDASCAISVVNMFIGGSPSGTAGGIKTTTFALLVIAALSEIKQIDDSEVFQRRVSSKLVRKALTIIILSLAWVSAVTILILTITGKEFLDVIFEVTSAFGTVGLSRNFTGLLNSASKVLIIMTMYIGRAGLMTVTSALYGKNKKKLYREAQESIIVG